ncbi:MAG: CheY-like chemotaxis protein [Candidatus Azotimanducaceae bacterium]|jgi:two-component system cell cycle sensor histidine kinase/response regulator CckA
MILTIYLPADKNSLDSRDTAPAGITEKPNSVLGHILVMDDEVSVRELFSSMLESCGYKVDFATDGAEALAKRTSASKTDRPFDIIILDLTIPGGKGGKEIITELLAVDPQVKVIISSGYATAPIMANYGDYGFSGRLTKPFTLTVMEKEVGRVMELR